MQVTAFVDRVEEDFIVLLVGEEGNQILWPKSIFPKDIKEGTIVKLTIESDEAATRAAEETIEELIDRLNRGA